MGLVLVQAVMGIGSVMASTRTTWDPLWWWHWLEDCSTTGS